ncbi:sodium/proline symporter [Elongatibacter sediminis]|uniref:Sodium/proline symporter n=1 Tax=Elongatibacter sediminis TaxID=3119006 RepID=A0AAW9RCR6_9GAMM
MDKLTVIAVTLVAYKLVLIGIGLWASSRNRDHADFFLGGRQLGPVVAAISYASSASSAWTMLGVSGAAFVLGVSVIWIALGSFTGMLVAWFWIGRRLMHHSRIHDQITLTDFLVQDATGRMRRLIVAAASVIIVFSFVFYVAAQFQGAGNTFSATFDMSMSSSIVLGGLIIMIYTLLGGFWAVSVTDTIQGSLMAATAILLPAAAVIEAGGFGGLVEGLQQVGTPQQLSLTFGNAGWVAAGIILGGLGIGFGTYGQPHLLVRFMALRDDRALSQARVITVVWYAVVFVGMMVLGLAGHVMMRDLGNPETVFFELIELLFSPVVGAVLLAAVLSAIMSTADSQLLVAASAVVHDLGVGGRRARRGLWVSRLAVVVLVVLAIAVAVFLPERIFSRVLFAWTALGAAFGPTVFARLTGRRIAPVAVLASIVTGFALAVVLFLLPNAPGDVAERVVPFFASALVLLSLNRKGAARPAAGPEAGVSP